MPPKKNKVDEAVATAAQEPKTFMEVLGAGGRGLVRPATTGRNTSVLPTGNLAVDILSGRGGLKGGTITTVTGDSNAGKSTLVYRTIAQGQARGMQALLWDTENRYSADIAEANGMDLEEELPVNERSVGVIQWSPYANETAEDEIKMRGTFQDVTAAIRVFFTSEKTMKYGGIFIIDSINFQRAQEQEQGTVKKAVAEGEAPAQEETSGGAGIALLPRLLADWAPELLGYVNRPNNFCIITRQYRNKIVRFGSNINFSGGNAILYATSFDILLDRVKKIAPSDEQKKAGWERMGDLVSVTSRKNTTATYGRRAEYIMSTQYGPDDIEMMSRYGVAAGMVENKGGWFKYLMPNGEWTKSMYLVQAQEFFWESHENLAGMYAIMDAIRKHYIQIPTYKKLRQNDSTRNTPSTVEPATGQSESVQRDAADIRGSSSEADI